MNYPALVTSLLNTSDPLKDIMTGGIYARNALKKNGLTEASYPEAFNANHSLKPVLIVAGRSQVAFSRVKVEQFKPIKQVIELYFHQDGNLGFTPIDQGTEIVYNLLHNKPLPGYAWKVEWLQMLDFYDPEFFNAATYRQEFMITGHLGS